jgi:hypothetical protein
MKRRGDLLFSMNLGSERTCSCASKRDRIDSVKNLAQYGAQNNFRITETSIPTDITKGPNDQIDLGTRVLSLANSTFEVEGKNSEPSEGFKLFFLWWSAEANRC